MTDLGKVIDVFSAPQGFKGSVRPRVEKLECIKKHGIKDDKFAGKNEDRAVMIVGEIAYDLAKEQGIELERGSLGENILLDFDPHTLQLGDILDIDGMLLQISELCSICNHLSVHAETLPALLAKHRGVYCRILKDGVITKGLKVCKQ